MSDTPGVAALERALKIVDCFTAHDKGLRLTEISARTGFYKSTILRLCASLEKFGYLTRLSDGRFVLGGALLRYGRIYQQSFNLADHVLPNLQRLSANTGYSSSFWIKDGSHRVCLYRVEAAHNVRAVSAQVGERWPLDKGGSSAAILRALSAPQDTRAEKTRGSLVVLSLGEFVPELAALSCPVFSSAGHVVGALSLGGFRSAFTPSVVTKLKPQVLAAAKDITASLGGDLSTYRLGTASVRPGRTKTTQRRSS